MKKLLLSIVISLVSFTVISQGCLPEGITFTTQDQIDSFQINYPGCTQILGFVEISGQDIQDLSELSELTVIMGSMRIWNNSSLTSLMGLNNIVFINGDLFIGGFDLDTWETFYGNPLLIDLSGFNSLSYIGGSLQVVDNYSLINLNGLQNLTTIGGDLFIGIGGDDDHLGNPSLINLIGLDSLTTIGGSFGVHYNYLLNSLGNLNGLMYIGGGLNIMGTTKLSNLTGLENLSSVGGIYIGAFYSDNSGLKDLSGLENITSVSGGISISFNDSLTSLSGLNNLTSIGGNLRIGSNWKGNPLLCNLLALENLTSIGGSLRIENNDSITSLAGLDNIAANTINDVYIIRNGSLSTCEVHSVCDYLAAPSGVISIRENAPGCNSQEEVEEACETVSVEEITLIGEIISSPNPFTKSTTIEYELKQPEKVTLMIYDYLGKQVYQTQENQLQGTQQLVWNAERYADGIYYYRLRIGGAIANGKMVKVR